MNNDILVTREVICQWGAREVICQNHCQNHCQITSLVTKTSLFTVTHALFFMSLFVLHIRDSVSGRQPMKLNSYVAKWRHMATNIWVYIGSGNGLLLNGTWTDVDLSFVGFCGIHLRASSHPVLQLLFCIMRLKIILLELPPHLQGGNVLRIM